MNPAVLGVLIAFEVLAVAVSTTVTWYTIPIAQTAVALTPVVLVLAGQTAQLEGARPVPPTGR